MAKSVSEHSYKMTADAAPFVGELTKIQKQLGLVRREDGLLVNSLGQVVEGLSNAKVAAGQFYDENGKLRNSQKQLIEGVSAVRQQMGFYKDDLGNVRNAQGQVVQSSKTLSAQFQSQAASANMANEKIRTAAASALQLTSNLIMLGGAGTKVGKTMFVISTAMSTFQSVASLMPNLVKGIQAINAVLKGTAALTAFVQGATGNIVGLVAGTAAAAGVAVWASSIGDESETAGGKVKGLTDNISDLRKEAEKLGKTNWGLSELSNVIGELSKSKNEKLLGSILNFDDMKANMDRNKRDIQQWSQEILKRQKYLEDNKRTWGKFMTQDLGERWTEGRIFEQYKADIEQFKKLIEDAKNMGDGGIAQSIGGLVSGILEGNKTDREKQQEVLDILKASIDQGLISGEEKTKTQNAISIIEKQMGNTLLAPLEKYKSQVDQVNESFAFLNQITDEEIRSSEAFKKAKDDYKNKLEQASKTQEQINNESLAKQINDQYGMNSEERYRQESAKLLNLLNQKLISEENYKRALDAETERYVKSTKYGNYLDKARESFITEEQKVSEARRKITWQAATAGYTPEETRKAISLAVEDIRKQYANNGMLGTQSPNRLAAAERGSLEAYSIIANKEDKSTKAINELRRENTKQNDAIIEEIRTLNTGMQLVTGIFTSMTTASPLGVFGSMFRTFGGSSG